MTNTFDPDMALAMEMLFGTPSKAEGNTFEAPPPAPAGHTAVAAREGNVLRVKFGKD